jgi:hypothetical protein
MIPIFLAVLFIAIILIIIVAGQDSDFVISRRVNISASPDKIFPHVNELRNWEAWNPWSKLDPNCKMTYGGSVAGVGATYAWAGNNKVGEGRNTITESKLNELVRLRLEFIRPMAGTNLAEFVFQTDGSQTTVKWSMSGKRTVVSKIFGLFMNFDRMIGGQFENGLAQMKSVVEGGR